MLKGCWFAVSVAFLATTSLSAGPEIVSLGPFGGDVRSLVVHPAKPNRFFLGTADGQIYVSNDSAQTWSRLVPGLGRRNLAIDNLAFDPSNPEILYAAAWELQGQKGWLFRSRDAGTSWENISLRQYHSTIRAIAIAPSDSRVIALGISEGVILSRDGGSSWDRITRGYRSLYNVESLAFDPHDSEILYVGTWHLGWKTTNGGKKWEPIHAGMIEDSDLFCLLVNPNDAKTLYSSACTGVYRSQNAGLSWTKLKNGLPKEAKRTRTLHLDPSDPNRVYAGTTIGLFVSSDSGSSWRQLLRDVVVNAVAVHPQDSRIILVGADDAGILKSTDSGETFSVANRGFIHRQIGALASDATERGRYYASVLSDRHYGGFFATTDHGAGWQSYNEGLGEAVSSIRVILPASRSRNIYIGAASGLFQTAFPDGRWQPVESTARLLITDLAFSNATEDGLFIASNAGVFHLDLKEQKLQKLVIPVYSGQAHVVLYDEESNSLFAGTEIGVFRSSDRGKTWTIKVTGLPPVPVNVLEKSNELIFCGTRQGLFSSGNGGETWTQCKGVFPIDIAAIKPNPAVENQLFAGDFLVGHLFRSDDGGANWAVVEVENSTSRIATLLFDLHGNILAGTVSDGVSLIKTREKLTSGQ